MCSIMYYEVFYFWDVAEKTPCIYITILEKYLMNTFYFSYQSSLLTKKKKYLIKTKIFNELLKRLK